MNTYDFNNQVVFNQDYFRSFEENEDHLLLDMDSLVQRKDEDLLMSRIYDSSMKKCSLGKSRIIIVIRGRTTINDYYTAY
jgi:hypothetical protein